MSYKVKIPLRVQREIDEALKIDGSHLRPHLSSLKKDLKKLREDPRSGYEIRRDFANGWFIEVGDYRLYYRIDDVQEEVRCFLFDRYFLGW